MAEGGGFENPAFDPDINPDEWVPDDEQDPNETTPFIPGSASTPGPAGEEIPMQTMQQEQSGLPSYTTGFEETSFGGRNVANEEIERRLAALRNPTTALLDTTAVGLHELLLSDEDKKKEIQKVKAFIRKRYPKVKFKSVKYSDGLDIRFSKKKLMDVVAIGPKGGETKIALDDGGGFRIEFLDKTYVQNAIGPTAESLLEKENVKIRESRQKLREAEKEMQKAEKLYSELVEAKQKEKDLLTKIERTKAKKEQLGSNVENESELLRLKQLEKNYQTDLENNKKELAALEKQVKTKEKTQTRVDQLSASLAAEVEKRNTLEDRLNPTKTLDEINEEEAELKRQNEEDRKIIDDENTSPSERAAAEERVAEREEELARLQAQIEEREREQCLFRKGSKRFSKNTASLLQQSFLLPVSRLALSLVLFLTL